LPRFLYGIADNDRGYIFCIECDEIVCEVPAGELQGTLTEMELTLDTCAEQCPHCVNLVVGFSKMFAYTCKNLRRGREADRRSQRLLKTRPVCAAVSGPDCALVGRTGSIRR